MSIIKVNSRSPIPSLLRGGVIALGNFDGFHRGHQSVIARARQVALEMNAPLIVATFWPHPRLVFQPAQPPFLLTSLRQRERLFAAAGADAILEIEFDKQVASLTPREFFTAQLVEHAAARAVVTGANYRFGSGRSGDVHCLRTLANEHGMSSVAAPPLTDGIGPVSSSRIRDALGRGDCQAASKMLTRPYALTGEICHQAGPIDRTRFDINPISYMRPPPGWYDAAIIGPNSSAATVFARIGSRPEAPIELHRVEPSTGAFDAISEGQIEVALIRRRARAGTLSHPFSPRGETTMRSSERGAVRH